MTALGDITRVREFLRVAATKVIKHFHQLVFEVVGDRQNRKHLREFTGFNFAIDSDIFEQKIDYVMNTFSENELVSIANILEVDSDVDKDSLVRNICCVLTDINSLARSFAENTELTDSDDDDFQDVGEKVETITNSANATYPAVFSNVSISQNVVPTSSFSSLNIPGGQNVPNSILIHRSIQPRVSIQPIACENITVPSYTVPSYSVSSHNITANNTTYSNLPMPQSQQYIQPSPFFANAAIPMPQSVFSNTTTPYCNAFQQNQPSPSSVQPPAFAISFRDVEEINANNLDLQAGRQMQRRIINIYQ
ncbi:unnamed protein product [Ceutorhynchus assimilis]|uniref:Uncharacterized protein n=1 Tax=Ceutorhynchus assimilis TaxID=467358 RepID=A0A9N9MSI4_9CUCU|nr:unnamed protein product [Ceutorhynchus assimilis]